MAESYLSLGYQSASKLCREYASTRGPGSTAKPGEHKFFKRLEPIISKRLDKANHENGFMLVFSIINFEVYVALKYVHSLPRYKRQLVILSLLVVGFLIALLGVMGFIQSSEEKKGKGNERMNEGINERNNRFITLIFVK